MQDIGSLPTGLACAEQCVSYPGDPSDTGLLTDCHSQSGWRDIELFSVRAAIKRASICMGLLLWDVPDYFQVQTEMMGDIHHYAWRAQREDQVRYLNPRDQERFANWKPEDCAVSILARMSFQI